MAETFDLIIKGGTVATPGGIGVTDIAVSGGRVAKGAAVRAVKSWKFRPAELHGRPVAVRQTTIVNFRLQ